MLAIAEVWIYFIYLLFFLGFAYSVGWLTVRFVRLLFVLLLPEKLLYYTFLGTFIIVVVYSIVKTLGITVNVIGFLFLYFIYRELKKTPTKSAKKIILAPEYSALWIYFLVLLALFLYRVLAMYDPQTGYLVEFFGIEKDAVWYSQIADSLANTGQENTFRGLNEIDKEYHGLIPYHYFELWLIAFGSRLFQCNTLYFLELVALPFFGILLYWAYEVLFRTFLPRFRWFYPFVLFLFLFSSVIYLEFFTRFRFGDFIPYHFIYGDHSLAYFNFKQMIVEVFLLLSILTWQRKNYYLTIIIILFLPIVNFLSAPSVLGGVFIFALLNLVFKWKGTNLSFMGLSCSFGILVYLIVFSSLFKP